MTDMAPDQMARIAAASRVILHVHRAMLADDPEDMHNPCCAFFCVDGPHGWFEAMCVCGCEWPKWEVRVK